MLVMICCASITAQAQVTTTLLSEDFSSGEQWPAGWYDEEGWPWSLFYEGAGGYNYSAVVNNWDYGSGPFMSPSMDAEIYSNASDVVTLEFDYWMDLNQYHRDYADWGYDQNDYLTVKVYNSSGSTQLIKLNVWDNYTYYNDNYFDYAITADADHWKHVTITIPEAALTSDMQIGFSASYDFTSLGNFAIDNVVIQGTHYTTYAYAPLSLNFGEIEVGQSSDIKTVTLTNDNDFDVAMSQYAIAGPGAAMFDLVSAPEFIPAFGQATIEVRFNALQFGVHTAELSFYGEVDKEQIGRVALVGSGVSPAISIGDVSSLFLKKRTQLGSYRDTFVVVTHSSNTGTLVISDESFISGDYADQYSIVSIPEFGLRPGESDTVWVRHNPTIEGSRSATLNIVSNAGNGVQTVELRGTGILQRFTITPTSHSFDSVAMLSTECQVFTLANPGSDTLRIHDIYFASNDGDFTFQSLGGTQMTIAPEQSREISVCFEPRRMGYRQARLRILTDIPMTFEGQPRDTSEFLVDLSGVGVPFGELTFGEFGVDSSFVGQELCQTDTLWNIGEYSITINSAEIIGANASEFELRDITFPLVIPAGGFAAITMCATPGDRGLRDAQIVVYATSNSRLDTILMPLSVFGQVACAQPSVLALFDAGMTLVNSNDSMMVTITNCGDVATIYTAALPSGTTDYQIIGSPVSTPVAPGATYDYWVRFTPSARGAITSNLQITGAGVTPMNIALNGTGAGVTASNSTFTIPQTPVGSSNAFSVTITNNGNIDWTTGTPLVTGAAYSTTSTGLTLAPGASGDITFTFTPTVEGTNTGSVTFPNANPTEDPAYVINLNGMGTAALSVGRVTEMNGFALEQNYPNPATAITSVRFTTPRMANVTIALVDMTGNVVKTITSGYQNGTHSVELDARDLPTGTYMYVLTSEGVHLSRHMTVVK